MRTAKLTLVAFLVLTFSLGWSVAQARSIYFDQGKVQFEKHNYKQARQYFEQVVRESPYDAGARYYLGLACQAMGDHRSARVEFDWVARNADVPQLKGYAMQALQALDEAAADGKKQEKRNAKKNKG
jgi:tetratricopeptide (TPR) repeat protein